jgi:hypothetical protein
MIGMMFRSSSVPAKPLLLKRFRIYFIPIGYPFKIKLIGSVHIIIFFCCPQPLFIPIFYREGFCSRAIFSFISFINLPPPKPLKGAFAVALLAALFRKTIVLFLL